MTRAGAGTLKQAEVLKDEIRLLVLCSRINPDENTVFGIRDLAARDICWDSFVRSAIGQRVFPLVFLNFRNFCADKVPLHVMEKLNGLFIRNTARNMFLLKALAGILDGFEKKGIDALPFKGPVLAETVYGDIALRVFTDLDILVAPGDALKARDLLLKKGYLADIFLSERQARAYLKKENFFHLFSPDGRVSIDLHWEMSGRYCLKPMYLDGVKMVSGVSNALGRSVLTLEPEILLVYLSIHNSSHQWEHLESVACMSEIIRSSGRLDWEAMVSFAKTYRSKRMLLTGLCLCMRLFDVRLPDGVSGQIIKDKGLWKVADGLILKLFRARVTSWSWRFSFVHLRIRDHGFDSLRYGLRLLFLSTVKEWQAFPLTPPFTFLHYALRPLRLARDAARFFHRHSL